MTAPKYAVPYVNLPEQTAAIKRELLASVERVLDGGRYILGPEVSEFEREFAAYCGSKLAVSVANGTCALHLVFRALGLGPGDEVITVPNSFIASSSSIALTGAVPVFVDVGEDLNMDPARIEAAITPRTKAILPVHLTGRPAPMTDILEIAKRRNLFVVEDAAQAVGATLDGKRVGGFGRAACFSLHPLKNLHAFGDGGMVTTDDAEFAAQLGRGRNHGLRNRVECEAWSFNCRLDEIQAAMLRVQLPRLDEQTRERRRLAKIYNDRLRDVVGVPDEGPGESCVYQTYVVLADRRDDLQQHLIAGGVEALVHYPLLIPEQPAAESLGCDLGKLPVAVRLVKKILSLPLYPGLAEPQQNRVITLVRSFYGR
jgi:dTDP-4-amino-4,6-dideoxygalactose transaminase